MTNDVSKTFTSVVHPRRVFRLAGPQPSLLPVSPEMTETIRILLMSDEQFAQLKRALKDAKRGGGGTAFDAWLRGCKIDAAALAGVYEQLSELMLSRCARCSFQSAVAEPTPGSSGTSAALLPGAPP